MPTLFDRLRERLLVAGVAPRHVRRYLAELADHLADLRAAEGSESAALLRLGTLEELAQPMLAKPEFRSWLARWPAATLVLGPLLAMVTATALFVALLFAGFYVIKPPGGMRAIEPMPFQIAVHMCTAILNNVVPLIIGWLLGWLVIQQRLTATWPLIGLAILAFVSGAYDWEVIFPKTLAEHGQMTLTFGWAPPFPHPCRDAEHGFLNFLLIAAPFVFWRWRVART